MNIERIISEALQSTNSVNVFLNGRYYVAKAPTVRVYARILEVIGVSLIDKLSDRILEILSKGEKEVMEQVVMIATGIKRKGFFSKCEVEELSEAFNDIMSLANAYDFFTQAPAREKRKESKTKIIGGKMLAGQVASFMEDLGMGLNEVLDTSYPLLLILQYDKPRPDYSSEKDEIEEVSGQDMLQRKRARA